MRKIISLCILIFFASILKSQNLAFSENELQFKEAYDALLVGDFESATKILEEEIFVNKNYEAVAYYNITYCVSADKKMPSRRQIQKATRKASKAKNAWGASFKKKYFKQALPLIIQKAENGNAIAQFRLALAYKNGFGVEENDDLVLKYLQMAADQGLSCAQFGLGQVYAEGIGVDQDIDKAIMNIEKSLSVNTRRSSQNYLEKLKKKIKKG